MAIYSSGLYPPHAERVQKSLHNKLLVEPLSRYNVFWWDLDTTQLRGDLFGLQVQLLLATITPSKFALGTITRPKFPFTGNLASHFAEILLPILDRVGLIHQTGKY